MERLLRRSGLSGKGNIVIGPTNMEVRILKLNLNTPKNPMRSRDISLNSLQITERDRRCSRVSTRIGLSVGDCTLEQN